MTGEPAAPRLRTAAGFLLTRLVVTVAWAVVVLAPLTLLVSLVSPLVLVTVVAITAVGVARGRTWRDGMRRRLSWIPDVIAQGAVAWTLAWRRAAQRERLAVARFSGEPIRATYRPLADGASGARVVALSRDPATWKDGWYFVASAILGLTAAGLLAAAWAGLLGLALAPPLLRVAGTIDPASVAMAEGIGPFEVVISIVAAVVLVAVVLCTPLLLRAMADLHVGLARALLGPGEQARLRSALDDQQVRRQLAVDAAEAERRRIERDLHDGAQQRLVSLAMSLGMAKERLPADPGGAEVLVDEAHREAKQALVELRDLARGIHPAVLADRGLDAALSAVASRAGVPVGVAVKLPRRPSATLESVAYFVVSEAITNVNRHASARHADVCVAADGDLLVVEVIDDGIGGADPGLGSGLAGLADRVGGAGGRLRVDSPLGGPTRIRAELPCVW